MTYADLGDLIHLASHLASETTSEKVADACLIVTKAARARRARLLRDMGVTPSIGGRETP
jgi:hypothetical protein